MNTRRMVLAAALLAVAAMARTDDPAPVAPKPAAVRSPCGSSAHGELDFWLGDWDVTNAAGAHSGTSHVERILDGCVVMEHWQGVRGGYAGKSFNTLDPASGQWTQHWVDNGGLSAIMTGRFQDGNLVYRRELTGKNGAPMTSRMTFFNLGADKVHQLVEQSSDAGKTWTKQFDLHYSRRAR